MAERSGDLFKHTADGFLARFDDLENTLAAMDDYQQRLAEEAWPEPIEIRSRVGVHWGPAEARLGDWFGRTINHLARLTDLVEPTHVVLSDAAQEACRELTGRCTYTTRRDSIVARAIWGATGSRICRNRSSSTGSYRCPPERTYRAPFV